MTSYRTAILLQWMSQNIFNNVYNLKVTWELSMIYRKVMDSKAKYVVTQEILPNTDKESTRTT